MGGSRSKILDLRASRGCPPISGTAQMMPSTCRPASVASARFVCAAVEPRDQLENDRVAVAVRFALDAGDGLGGTEILETRRDDGDRVAAAIDQAARQDVGLVAQFVDDTEDPLRG